MTTAFALSQSHANDHVHNLLVANLLHLRHANPLVYVYGHHQQDTDKCLPEL